MSSPSFDAAPVSAASSPAPLECAATLDRVRRLLDVAWVGISTINGPHFRLLASSGALDSRAELDLLDAQAGQHDGPFIIGDTHAAQAMGNIRFYAGITCDSVEPSRQFLLSIADDRPRRAAMAQQLAAIATDVVNRATIARLEAELVQHVEQRERRFHLFDKASATAKIGLWQCDLVDDNRLSWTNGIYDLFELPYDTALTRELTLAFYTEQSRREMETARALAIAEGIPMDVDAEIITAKGNSRWMRLTGTVERIDGKSVRILGMKQDITEKKLLSDRTRYLAEYDVMTGLANRSQFQSYLDDMDGKQLGALLLVDLDGFKQINDTYGHAVGDQCIRQAAQRLKACCGAASLVARVGGDEFGVLIGATLSIDAVQAMAVEVVMALSRPVETTAGMLASGASVGVAYRKLQTGEDLFRHADAALYAAKAAGRNTSRTFELAA